MSDHGPTLIDTGQAAAGIAANGNATAAAPGAAAAAGTGAASPGPGAFAPPPFAPVYVYPWPCPWPMSAPPYGPPPPMGFGPPPPAGPAVNAAAAGPAAAMPPPDMAKMMQDLANGNTSSLSGLAKMLNLDDKDFWKGALVGAAAVLLLTNENVQRALFRGAVKSRDAVHSGVEKVKKGTASVRRRTRKAQESDDE